MNNKITITFGDMTPIICNKCKKRVAEILTNGSMQKQGGLCRECAPEFWCEYEKWLEEKYPLSLYEYPQGMTVRELKELIRDWPEEDEFGNETDVFIETGKNLSGPVLVAGR